MRHGVKKIKIRFGKDANKMLFRKLVNNFLRKSKLTTTEAKAKLLKPILEKLVEKTKKETESNRNYLIKYLQDSESIKLLYEKVGPAVVDKVGGYVRLVKLLPRDSDGAKMARIEWVHPAITEEREKTAPEKKVINNKDEKENISKKK